MHLVDRHFVDRAEAVLDRPHDTVVLELVPFEVEDRVDDMLERLRAGDRPFLGDVADEEDRDGEPLGGDHEHAGRVADLSDTTRCRGVLRRVDRLDRVDDHSHRLHRLRRVDDLFDRRLAEEVNPVVHRPEPPGPHGDLPRRFLSRGIEDRTRGGQLVRRLQEQGRLADARLPSHEHHTAENEPAAQHPVEARQVRGDPRRQVGADGPDRHRRRRRVQRLPPRCLPRLFFRVGVPGIALGAAPEPLVRLIAAFETGEDDCFLGHLGSDCSNRVQTLYDR